MEGKDGTATHAFDALQAFAQLYLAVKGRKDARLKGLLALDFRDDVNRG